MSAWGNVARFATAAMGMLGYFVGGLFTENAPAKLVVRGRRVVFVPPMNALVQGRFYKRRRGRRYTLRGAPLSDKRRVVAVLRMLRKQLK